MMLRTNGKEKGASPDEVFGSVQFRVENRKKGLDGKMSKSLCEHQGVASRLYEQST
jgi:hypothetical protein